MAVLLVAYAIFSFVFLKNVTHSYHGVLKAKSSERLSSVWLDDSPFHQVFSGNKLVGIRIYLTNPDEVSEGLVSIRLGLEETGEELYSTDVLATDIPSTALEEYVEIIPEDVKFEDGVKYYVEVDGFSCMPKTVKTFLGATEGDQVYHAGDDSDYGSKALCIDQVQEILPFGFVIWILITVLLVLFVSFSFSKYEQGVHVAKKLRIPTSRESLIVLAVVVIVAGLGTYAVFHVESLGHVIDLEDKELENGYTLEEHSSYEQEFTVEREDLKEIYVRLYNYFENTATFVVSIQKGTDVVGTIQDNELEYDGAYLIWDVSELNLPKGETYNLFVYTGFIEEDQEKPVIKKIVYVYK